MPFRFSGADLAGLVREAAMQALRRSFVGVDLPSDAVGVPPELVITKLDFLQALRKVTPSVSEEDEALFKASGGVFK